MVPPRIVLGVPLMDEDHVRLERLLQRVAEVGDAALPGLLAEVETETVAHFEREEGLMRSAGVPVLCCHIAQHSCFISEFSLGREAIERDDMAGLREFLTATLPELLHGHIDTVDRVTAIFLQDHYHGK